MILRPGSVFGDRFDIDRMITRGGMGMIYRARDRYTGQQVALKLLIQVEGIAAIAAERFIREAHLLSQLRHPSIVGYVAHGQTPEGQLFLATQWLEGEDLGARITGLGLTLPESLVCIRAAAAGLQAAHARGIVHRDVKPANLFLRDCRVERTTVLDFGIARPELLAQTLTATGCAIGTPNYMAPEQARGERVIGPAADIFSLGCVLFQCLTGRPPFVADHPMAVLSKILAEEAPSALTVHPGLPPAVDGLLKRMLVRDPQQRIHDVAELLHALDGLGSQLAESARVPAEDEEAVAISGETHPQLCVIVGVATGREREDVATLADIPVRADMRTMPILIAESPVVAPLSDSLRSAVAATAQSHGAQARWLADGSLVVALSGNRPLTDLVQAGARCALALARTWPEGQFSMATGRGSVTQEYPSGDVVARAFKLVRSMVAVASGDAARGAASAKADTLPAILVDDTSSGLLDGRYQLERNDRGLILLSGELSSEEGRRLLGKPAPCVGREQELHLLSALFASCEENAEANAVLISAACGVGKSRLKHELLRRLEARPEPPLVLAARGDMQNPGVPYSLIGQALRRLCQLQDGLPQEDQRQRLSARIGEHIAAEERRFVCEFIGELCGVHFSDAESAPLHAARLESRLMRDQLAHAFTQFIQAECSQRAVVVVLDDLHWGDAQTVQLIDTTLRILRDQPLLIVALGRPEVSERFPGIWKDHKLQLLPLKNLSQRSCQRLVEHVLGKNVEPAVMNRMIDQSSGNALFLEGSAGAPRTRGRRRRSSGFCGGSLRRQITTFPTTFRGP